MANEPQNQQEQPQESPQPQPPVAAPQPVAAPAEERPFEEELLRIYRCATVVKGGRRFSFGALVVAGNRAGRVGWGYGKAKEVPQAVDKGTKAARRAAVRVQLSGSTIPHQVDGRFGSSRVRLVPASEGTGVIAGASVRGVLELAGVRDCLTKAYGSTNPKNLVKATLDALTRLRNPDAVERLRGVPVTPRRSAGGQRRAKADTARAKKGERAA